MVLNSGSLAALKKQIPGLYHKDTESEFLEMGTKPYAFFKALQVIIMDDKDFLKITSLFIFPSLPSQSHNGIANIYSEFTMYLAITQSVDRGPATLALPRSLQEKARISGSNSYPLNQNLHFNKTSR